MKIAKIKQALCVAVDVMLLDQKHSNWSKAQTSESRRGFILQEAQELLDTQDPNLLFSEVNDVLAQTIALILHYVELGYDPKVILGDRIFHKYLYRKPHIFIGAHKTEQEELEDWQTAKNQEKQAHAKSSN